MAASYEILSVSTSASENVYEKIKFVCGKNEEGGKWCVSQEKAVRGIQNKQFDFYIRLQGKKIKVVVGSHYGKKYLKTEQDEKMPECLLKLPAG